MMAASPDLGRVSGIAVLAAACLALMAATLPAAAGWRDDMKTFRIGIVAAPGAGQAVPGLAAIERAYTMALGIPVEVLVATDYPALIDAQATGRVEYAIYSATAYATAWKLCQCVEPVAAPVGDDGATGLRAVLVTRDGKLSSLDQIPDRRVAVVGGDSIAGLAAAELGDIFDSAASRLIEAPSPSAAEAMLIDGSADAIFGWTPASGDPIASFGGGTLARLQAAGVPASSLSVVWSSELLRYGPHTIRTGLDPEVRQILTIFLTNMLGQSPDLYERVEQAHGGGFQAVAQADYASAIEMVKRMAGTTSDIPADIPAAD
jgi:phosphonate transport system substrate-binding protein